MSKLDPRRVELAIKQLQELKKNIENASVPEETKTQIIEIVNRTMGNFRQVISEQMSALVAEFELMRATIGDFEKVITDDLMVQGEFIAKDMNAATGSFSKWLTGVNIVGDNIVGGTISTDRLIIRDPENNTGILYEINNGVIDQTELTEEELKRVALDGKVLVANSVTADKINVTDLFSQNITAYGNFSLGGKGALTYDKETDALDLRAQSITLGAETVATEEELEQKAAEILATAENITLGIVSGYTTASDLATYKTQIENLFKGTEEGFSFEFEQIKSELSDVGNKVTEQSQYIRLIDGKIHIGHSDSPVTAVFTNDSLEFRYNGHRVARFTDDVLEVENIAVGLQVTYFEQWATRQGAEIAGVGYNLNDMWIGG